jgi:hypothetical protein
MCSRLIISTLEMLICVFLPLKGVLQWLKIVHQDTCPEPVRKSGLSGSGTIPDLHGIHSWFYCCDLPNHQDIFTNSLISSLLAHLLNYP